MPLRTPGSKSGHLAGALRQTDPRHRIALLQSLIGVNQDHVRMVTGMRSTHLSPWPEANPGVSPGGLSEEPALRGVSWRHQALRREDWDGSVTWDGKLRRNPASSPDLPNGRSD
jgi:hypothetical protein